MIIPILLSIAGFPTATPQSVRSIHNGLPVLIASQGKKLEVSAFLADKPLADNTAVAGEIKFTVKVVSTNAVSNVEFYVGDDIRDTD